MDIAARQSSSTSRTGTERVPHRCPQCRTDALVMHRRHVSSPGWGAPVVTEYYECDYCEARYSYSPADGRWKLLSQ